MSDDEENIYLKGKQWGRERYALSIGEVHRQMKSVLDDIPVPKHKILFSEGAGSGRDFEKDQRELTYL